jgi:PTS system mannose-specific IIA component
MTAGLLLVTHKDIGAALLAAATRMLGGCPLPARTLAVVEEGDCDRLRALALAWVAELDQGDGVLVLTDLFGSTPANIAASLQSSARVRALSGVNLPMLVRILNYPDLPLDALAEKAYGGGRDGVMFCRRSQGQVGTPAEVCER